MKREDNKVNTDSKKTEGGWAVKNNIKIQLETRLALIVLFVVQSMVASVQIADAPPVESLILDDIACYQIDSGGRIFDDNGRLRGWIRDGKVYTPGFEPKYIISGKQLKNTD